MITRKPAPCSCLERLNSLSAVPYIVFFFAPHVCLVDLEVLIKAGQPEDRKNAGCGLINPKHIPEHLLLINTSLEES